MIKKAVFIVALLFGSALSKELPVKLKIFGPMPGVEYLGLDQYNYNKAITYRNLVRTAIFTGSSGVLLTAVGIPLFLLWYDVFWEITGIISMTVGSALSLTAIITGSIGGAYKKKLISVNPVPFRL